MGGCAAFSMRRRRAHLGSSVWGLGSRAIFCHAVRRPYALGCSASVAKAAAPPMRLRRTHLVLRVGAHLPRYCHAITTLFEIRRKTRPPCPLRSASRDVFANALEAERRGQPPRHHAATKFAPRDVIPPYSITGDEITQSMLCSMFFSFLAAHIRRKNEEQNARRTA